MFRKKLKLIDRGRAIASQATSMGERPSLAKRLEFCARGSLSGSMKAYHKNPQWLVFTKLRRSFAEQLDQLVVDDFDDLLTGRYRFEYFLAQAASLT